jgi:hypothetical protein
MDNAGLVLTRSKAERIRDLVLELDKQAVRDVAVVLAAHGRPLGTKQ